MTSKDKAEQFKELTGSKYDFELMKLIQNEYMRLANSGGVDFDSATGYQAAKPCLHRAILNIAEKIGMTEKMKEDSNNLKHF